ncbi:MAG TPA: hypothetical protein VG675_24280 [Bryobacteraceae bacterium]|nr:hypothetical protein [Bryobacteraceae bacterium]
MNPVGIAADHSGNLYIAELCMIRKVTSSGALTTVAGTGRCASEAREGPVGSTDLPDLFDVAVTSQGQVYAADEAGDLLSITPGKTIALISGVQGVKRLATDSKDRLYATVYSGQEVIRLVAGAAPELYVAGGGATVRIHLDANTAIALDRADDLYLASGPNGRFPEMVYIVKPDGGSVESRSINASPPLESLAVDPSGNIYGTNHSLVGFDYFPGAGFRGDGGPLASARTSLALRIITAPSGGFYFLDANNRRVRKISGSPPSAAPAFSAAGVVNAASGLSGPIAPGELVSIYGTNLGPASGWITTPENNFYPGIAGYSHVLMGPGGTFSNGSDMPILLAATNQINAFIPYSALSTTAIPVRVEVDGLLSPTVTLPVAASAFGLFTANGSGSGQGAILNQDGSYNDAMHPASRGSIVSFFGTGDGIEIPSTDAGALVLSTPYPRTAAAVAVMIGGQPADVLYAGAAPFLAAGVTQINARIPEDVAPGDAPVVISIGEIAGAQSVTVSVK